MKLTSFPIVIVQYQPSCTSRVTAHDKKVLQPLLQAYLTADRLCLCLGGELTDADPPTLFPLRPLQYCGEGRIAALSIVGDDLLSFGLGLEGMDLDGKRFTGFP